MPFFKPHPCFTTYFFAAVPSENTLTILKPTKISVPLIIKVLLIKQLDPPNRTQKTWTKTGHGGLQNGNRSSPAIILLRRALTMKYLGR